MMKTMIVVIASLAAGCSVVDPWDMDDLREDIASMPADAAASAKQWAANRAAIDRLEDENENLKIFGITCHDKDGYLKDEEFEVLAKDILRCLGASFTKAYADCVNEEYFSRSRSFYHAAQHVSTSHNCENQFTPGWNVDEVPDEWFPRNVTNDDIIDAMVRYAGSVPPPFVGALPGGFIGRICRLPQASDETWGCPGNPSDLPEQNPGSGDPGDYP